ncbi:DNA-3-methyladenine glycosylase I [uncultured Aquabacterium sp.]|uniref:DNA-3-methyladenine glycosylase I n=1 Tax=uncultured Aquabacterium sp. TaxID=158753 RepID=UPI002617EE52|nr:DNA-3-methyladenine glycosylase I [uncultured Aquabacterium sp.]
MSPTAAGPDGLVRCRWCLSTPAYRAYHDEEWGFPVADDRRLFEKICLEGFQSGLSWLTILNKRDAFRRAFAGFDFHRVAGFTEADVDRMLQDEGIVRHRGKIEAAIHNAARALELVSECGSLAAFFWRFEAPRTDEVLSAPVATSEASIALSKELKRRGWKYVGPTTMYAFMQAMGLVNDHAADCAVRAQVAEARQRFQPPQLG